MPLVFEIRDLWPSVLVDLGAIRRGGLAHRVLELLERLCYRVADRIVIVPPHADRRVRRDGCRSAALRPRPERVTARCIGHDAAYPDTLEAIFAACGSREILMYAGAQGVSNGLEVVLDALDHLRTTDPSRTSGSRWSSSATAAGTTSWSGGRPTAEPTRSSYFHPPIDKAAVPGALARATILLVAFADANVYRLWAQPEQALRLPRRRPSGPARLQARRHAGQRGGRGTVLRARAPAHRLAEGIVALLALTPDERVLMGLRGQELVAPPVHHRRDRRASSSPRSSDVVGHSG